VGHSLGDGPSPQGDGGKNPKFFFGGAGGFWDVFLGVATEFPERQSGLGVWKTPRGVQNAPVSRDYGPDLARKWTITARVLPRKTLDLATMLFSDVDGIAVFLRSLAWDLRAGEGGVVSTQRTQPLGLARLAATRAACRARGSTQPPGLARLARLVRLRNVEQGLEIKALVN